MQTQMNIPVHTKEQARTQPRTPAPDCEKRGYLEGDFRLFHLEDTAGEPIGYHYHEFDKIILFIKGSVEYIIEGRSYRLEPYDIVLVNHHDIHQPKINPAMPYERIIVYQSPSFISSWSGEGYDLNACCLRAGEFCGGVLRIRGLKNSRMFQAIERLEEACRQNGYAEDLYRRLLFLEFMVHLNRAALNRHVEYVRPQPHNQKVLEIMEYIHSHLTGDISVDLLAEHFFISRYHMMRLFRQETGYTIGGYLNEKRLLLARELLAQGVPLSRLALDGGFKNDPAFLRAWKKAFGTTPAAAKHAGIS